MAETTVRLPSGQRAPWSVTAHGDGFLVEIYGGDIGRLHPIAGELSIGRDASNQVAVELPTVSRHHARVVRRDGRFYAVDLGSTNGTFVAEREIDAETELVNGDLLQTGGAIFKFITGGNVETLYHEEIYRLTIVDGLTGVHNRRYLLDFLDREVARSWRHDRPLSLALMDVDNFKAVNDVYGHLAGDSVLRELARRLAAQVRREELLARWGGEELAVVLPETDLEGAVQVGERLRALVAEKPFRVEDEEVRLTVSVGVATLEPGQTAESLLADADRRLYRAKDLGRDRLAADDDTAA